VFDSRGAHQVIVVAVDEAELVHTGADTWEYGDVCLSNSLAVILVKVLVYLL
jgi:hypothetical protein